MENLNSTQNQMTSFPLFVVLLFQQISLLVTYLDKTEIAIINELSHEWNSKYWSSMLFIRLLHTNSTQTKANVLPVI